ncbi:hypothetical protein [Sphingomonas sp. GM_Shp_1]|uniref:hypothetical protein n=1 Tax=Sphingomonas sp. GM_Shp_1 TaxID=2937381 RepID=UPI00226BB23E|nr:hypothetical protein [Sphingomonas sp. GM_Shp_1]
MIDMKDYVVGPTAGASAGLTGALALAYRTATRRWPMHWRMAQPSNTNKETVDA